MMIYISSFDYQTTTKRVSKTKDIKLLEEKTSRREFARLALNIDGHHPVGTLRLRRGDL